MKIPRGQREVREGLPVRAPAGRRARCIQQPSRPKSMLPHMLPSERTHVADDGNRHGPALLAGHHACGHIFRGRQAQRPPASAGAAVVWTEQ